MRNGWWCADAGDWWHLHYGHLKRSKDGWKHRYWVGRDWSEWSQPHRTLRKGMERAEKVACDLVENGTEELDSQRGEEVNND